MLQAVCFIPPLRQRLLTANADINLQRLAGVLWYLRKDIQTNLAADGKVKIEVLEALFQLLYHLRSDTGSLSLYGYEKQAKRMCRRVFLQKGYFIVLKKLSSLVHRTVTANWGNIEHSRTKFYEGSSNVGYTVVDNMIKNIARASSSRSTK